MLRIPPNAAIPDRKVPSTTLPSTTLPSTPKLETPAETKSLLSSCGCFSRKKSKKEMISPPKLERQAAGPRKGNVPETPLQTAVQRLAAAGCVSTVRAYDIIEDAVEIKGVHPRLHAYGYQIYLGCIKSEDPALHDVFEYIEKNKEAIKKEIQTTEDHRLQNLALHTIITSGGIVRYYKNLQVLKPVPGKHYKIKEEEKEQEKLIVRVQNRM